MSQFLPFPSITLPSLNLESSTSRTQCGIYKPDQDSFAPGYDAVYILVPTRLYNLLRLYNSMYTYTKPTTPYTRIPRRAQIRFDINCSLLWSWIVSVCTIQNPSLYVIRSGQFSRYYKLFFFIYILITFCCLYFFFIVYVRVKFYLL